MLSIRAMSAGAICSGIVLTAAVAQTPGAPPVTHKEEPNMPPIVAPGPRMTTPPLPPETLRVGPFQSVQVNVDGAGNNIVGDAANEPSIAVHRVNGNQIAIGWRQFDSILSDFRQAGHAYSTNAGSTWTNPGVFTPGLFRSDPVLACDSNGRMYYNSLQSNFNCDMFISTNGGQTWGNPIPAFGGDKQWMVIDLNPGATNSNIYVCWSFTTGCCGSNIFTRSFDDGLSYRNPTSIPNAPQFGTMAVDASGTVWMCGRRGDDIRVSRSLNAKNSGVNNPSWTTTTVDLGGPIVFESAINPVGLLGQVNVRADISNGPTRNFVYLAASVQLRDGSDPLDFMFTRSTNGGTSWEPPRRINHFGVANDGSSQWFGAMDVAPNGRIDAIYLDTRYDPLPVPQFSHLRYSASFDGGVTWRYDIAVSPEFMHNISYPVQRKIGDYMDLQSDNSGCHVAYPATFNGEQDVYHIRLAFLDCNNNGQLDVNEIDQGLLPDCNGNDIPDACELNTQYALDCNGNGAPDECDIGSGFEQDCDANGVPDSCDILGGAPDCNGNGVPDACDLQRVPQLDCNVNGEVDSCEIAAGQTPDCNQNGRPDECDLSNLLEVDSPALSPIGDGFPQSWTLTDPPAAIGTVTFTLKARGDFSTSTEVIHVTLNGLPLGTFFGSTNDCPDVPAVQMTTVPAEFWNVVLAGGDASFVFTASDTVNADLCVPASFVRIKVSYPSDQSDSEDSNMNGIPDECEQIAGDLNCDGVISVSDIGPFVLLLTDPAGYAAQFPDCDPSRGDINNDGLVTVSDIGPFVALLSS